MSVYHYIACMMQHPVTGAPTLVGHLAADNTGAWATADGYFPQVFRKERAYEELNDILKKDQMTEYADGRKCAPPTVSRFIEKFLQEVAPALKREEVAKWSMNFNLWQIFLNSPEGMRTTKRASIQVDVVEHHPSAGQRTPSYVAQILRNDENRLA